VKLELGDNEQPADAGKRGDDLLDHAVDKVFLLWVAADVLERQHRDRRHVGKREGSLHPRSDCGHRAYTIGPDRLGDILDPLLAKIGERNRQFVADMVAYHGRDANLGGFGQGFETGSDVHAVAKQVVAVNYNVADMHADAEAHLLAASAAGIIHHDRVLYRHSARDGINRAGEIGHYTVARGVENAAAMSRNQPVDDDPTSLEPGMRAHFVLRHEPAVAGNVGCEDR
jgi:hypothetical protein